MKLIELFNKDMTPNWGVFEGIFPEMATCKHSEQWHKEGSPLNHTKLVVEEMYKKLKDVEKVSEHFLIMMSAAMLHDIGKPKTTYWDNVKNDWCCKSHGESGEKLFRNMFFEERLDLREKVAYMIRYHMLLHHTMQKKEDRKRKELIQLLYGTVPFEDMLLLNECDMRGSINEDNNEDNIQKHLLEINNELEIIKLISKSNTWYYVNKHTAIMYVMIGIPGSGKSTYAQFIQNNEKQRGFLSLPIISRDTVRIEMGLCGENEKCVGTKSQEKAVTHNLEEKMEGLASMGVSFIIDNTSLRKKYRDRYYEIIKKYDVAPIFVYVEAPSIEDNINRREGQIDEETIRQMWKYMDFPNKNECYELWLVDQRTNKTYKI